jgi:hypothetical protein
MKSRCELCDALRSTSLFLCSFLLHPCSCSNSGSSGITLLTAEIQPIPLLRRFPKRIFEGKDQAMERNCRRNAVVILRAKSCQMDLELERRRKSKNHLTSTTMPRFGQWPCSLPSCPDSARLSMLLPILHMPLELASESRHQYHFTCCQYVSLFDDYSLYSPDSGHEVKRKRKTDPDNPCSGHLESENWQEHHFLLVRLVSNQQSLPMFAAHSLPISLHLTAPCITATTPAALHESPTHLTAYIMQDGGRLP